MTLIYFYYYIMFADLCNRKAIAVRRIAEGIHGCTRKAKCLDLLDDIDKVLRIMDIQKQLDGFKSDVDRKKYQMEKIQKCIIGYTKGGRYLNIQWSIGSISLHALSIIIFAYTFIYVKIHR